MSDEKEREDCRDLKSMGALSLHQGRTKSEQEEEND